jgi:hypothetical protein
MYTMEFDEIKKVWNSQTNEPVYIMNEAALHNRIKSKKMKAYHTANISELMAIISYFVAGGVLLITNYTKEPGSVALYLLSAWMVVSGVYFLRGRLKRIKGNQTFDRSMRGDLLYAISTATYQVRFSHLVRWNVLPVGGLIVLSMLEGGKPIWVSLLILAFLAITIYASGWEHNIYKARKKELDVLYVKLRADDGTVLN